MYLESKKLKMFKLQLHPFRVWFRLGCKESERAQVQPVDVSVDIEFEKAPEGCFTDELSQVVDYTDFIAIARDLAKVREFKLIEHLAYNLHSEFAKIVNGRAKLSVKVHKLHPPMDGMAGGVSFVYSG
jgi:dihydroneopterin aldolase